MQRLTMQEACKNLHWHDSWSEYMKYDEVKQELIIEIELCGCENCPNILFEGESGTIIFHGVSDFKIDTIIERTLLEFSVSECLSNNEKLGLLLAVYSYEDFENFRNRKYDWLTLSFFADSASWHPKP